MYALGAASMAHLPPGRNRGGRNRSQRALLNSRRRRLVARRLQALDRGVELGPSPSAGVTIRPEGIKAKEGGADDRLA